MTPLVNVRDFRKADFDINPLFLNRWSPRSLSGEDISKDELMPLFEAARWAPSSYNNQPWRFLYALKNTDHWSRFFGLLVKANQAWAQHAAALIVIVSKTTFDHNGKPSITHSYDSGAAWLSIALQGSLAGLVVHGMQGFDYSRAREILQIPDDYQVEAMAAVGKPGVKDDLSPALKEREVPSGRKRLAEIVFEGGMSA